jgi:hypothetical protein
VKCKSYSGMPHSCYPRHSSRILPWLLGCFMINYTCGDTHHCYLSCDVMEQANTANCSISWWKKYPRWFHDMLLYTAICVDDCTTPWHHARHNTLKSWSLKW